MNSEKKFEKIYVLLDDICVLFDVDEKPNLTERIRKPS